MAHRIRRTGRSRAETIARRIVAVHAFSRENQSTRYRAGDRFRVGLSLACGLIWASAAMGDHDGTFAAAVQYAAGDQPRSVAIADLNGDQVPDLAVANYNSDNVSVLLGVGDGAFATAVNYATGAEPTSVAIGDLNGDQMPDLAVTNDGFDTVSVLLGVGDGTFALAVLYGTGNSPQSVAIGDLDGDQVPDLVVANRFRTNLVYHVSVHLGDGDGTFAAAANYATEIGPVSVAIGDLDGDLVPDLAVANVNDNVSVLLGVGDGTFVAEVHYDTGERPTSVAIGDLDGDQAPDLVVTNRDDDNLSVLLGFGDGTFAAAMPNAAGNQPYSVVIGDLDGDQVLDLAVANRDGGDVSVLLGVGDGTFAAAVHHAAGIFPFAVAIGDLDGDQSPDLVVANNFSDNVSVLLNPRIGACCHGNDCSIVTSSDCLNSGGVFFGHHRTCDETFDTDGDGVPDACDRCPGADDAADADGDGTPDDCDLCPAGDDRIDSDEDGVPDACDACDNNFPDDCTFVSPILAAAPHHILKNRYISIDPRGQDAFNEGGVPFHIRVKLVSTLVNGVTAVGGTWWVNAPDAKCISLVGPSQLGAPSLWKACPTLHLTGCPIIPTSTYEIVAVVDGLQSGPALVAGTQARPDANKWWGDAVGVFTGANWTGPQGVTNYDDVNASVRTFQNPNAINATHVSMTDLHPNRPDLGGNSVHPNKLVSIDDVFSLIKAFQGDEYPGFALDGCTDP